MKTEISRFANTPVTPTDPNVVRWIARALGTLLVVAFVPFYLGYGNQLPFLNPDYTAHDNAWLCAFPLIFLGLILGWFKERIGGGLVVAAILFAQLVTLLTQGDIVLHMLVPLAVGLLFIFAGCCHPERESNLQE